MKAKKKNKRWALLCQPVKHHHAAVALLSTMLVVVLLMTAQVSSAANAVYTFTARGTITSVDEAGKTIKVDVTTVTGKGKADMEGTNREFKVGSAKVMKQIGGKDVRGTYHNLAIGQEVGVKGKFLTDDTFDLNFIRVHERAFSVIGRLQEHVTGTRTVKILVESSTYKPGTYKKGTEITMTYPEDATFYEKVKTTPVVFSDVNADAQRVKVVGTITSANSWQVKQLFNNYRAKK